MAPRLRLQCDDVYGAAPADVLDALGRPQREETDRTARLGLLGADA
ncbi:hypothetical protein [Streptomyces sp. NPDC046859]